MEESSRPLYSSADYYLEFALKDLDRLVSERRIHTEYALHRWCDVCRDRIIGLLDESRFQFVPGYLYKKWITPFNNEFLIGYGTPRASILTTENYYSAYTMRQLIVKSGLYSNEQLAGYRFSQHELEINEQSFIDCRSVVTRCGCTPTWWGYSEYEGAERAPSPDIASPSEVEERIARLADEEWASYRNHKSTTHVEDRFIGGQRTRTGYRRRSPEARIRRAKKRGQSLKRSGFPEPQNSALGTGLFSINPDVRVELEFKESGCLTRRNRMSKSRNESLEALCREDKLTKADKRMSAKSFYFLRKKGVFYHSVHSELFRGRRPVRDVG